MAFRSFISAPAATEIRTTKACIVLLVSLAAMMSAIAIQAQLSQIGTQSGPTPFPPLETWNALKR